MHVLSPDVQGPSRSEIATKHRSRYVIKNPASPGTDRDNLRQRTYVNARLGADRSLCATLGRAARKYIEESHSMKVRSRQIEGLLLGLE